MVADVSQRKLEANRRNAQKSTGPKSEAGKARASRNAVTHGVFSSVLVVDVEDKVVFEQFRSGMMRDLSPQGEMETMLSDKVITCAWKMRRLVAAERDALQHGVEKLQHKLDEKWKDDRRYTTRQQKEKLPPAPARAGVEQVFDAIPERIHKYEQMLERSLYKAMDQLQRWQKLRGERPEVDEEQPIDESMDQNEPTTEYHGLPARDGRPALPRRVAEATRDGDPEHGLVARGTEDDQNEPTARRPDVTGCNMAESEGPGN